MDCARIRCITGISGLMVGVMAMLVIPLYFMYAGPPPAWNVFTRNLLGLVSCAFLLLFITGFSDCLRQAGAAYEASLVYAAGLLFVAVTLVAVSLEAGAVFGAPDGTVDPTIHGPLADANILIHGSIKRLLTVLLLVPAGYAVLRSGMLPRGIGWAAYVIAFINLLFIPSIYFGKDATAFYSALGWGNTAFTASFLGFWLMAVGIALLRQPRDLVTTAALP
jgi:hypothetical protein